MEGGTRPAFNGSPVIYQLWLSLRVSEIISSPAKSQYDNAFSGGCKKEMYDNLTWNALKKKTVTITVIKRRKEKNS